MSGNEFSLARYFSATIVAPVGRSARDRGFLVDMRKGCYSRLLMSNPDSLMMHPVPDSLLLAPASLLVAQGLSYDIRRDKIALTLHDIPFSPPDRAGH